MRTSREQAVQDANCAPVIFQLYMSVGIMLSSWLVYAAPLPLLVFSRSFFSDRLLGAPRLLWEPFAFTWWGLPATVVWTAGSTISVQVRFRSDFPRFHSHAHDNALTFGSRMMQVINDIGMSIGQGVWSGFVVS